MKIQKGLLIGLVGALLVGAVEAAGENYLAAGESDADAKDSIMVPPGNVGDRLVYANFHRDPGAESWVRDPDRAVQITGLEQRMDASGSIHDVVMASTRGHSSNATGGLANRELAFASRETYSFGVDLSTRDFLGWRNDYEADLQSFFAIQSRFEAGIYAYGPWMHTWASGEAADKYPLLTYAGRTYRAGESEDAFVPDLLGIERTLMAWGWGSVDLADVQGSGRVGAAGVVDGVPAMPLITEGCGRLSIGDPANAYFGGGPAEVSLLGFYPVPVPAHVCFTVTNWVTEDRPYPVLLQASLSIDGGPARESMASLAIFSAGDRPIPWKNVPVTPYRMDNPDLERSPADQHYPADGADAELMYPLSRAIQTVQQDVSLIPFTVWKASRPDGRLIGAYMEPSGKDSQGRTWSLAFGSPSGDAYVVQTAKASPEAAPVQTAAGNFTVAPFAPAEPPAGQITLAAAVGLWKTAFKGAPRDPVPDRIAWGYTYYGEGLDCPHTGHCKPGTRGLYGEWNGDTLSSLYLYTTLKIAGVPGGYPVPVPSSEPRTGLMFVLDGDSGLIEGQVDWKRDVHVEPLTPPADYEPPRVQSEAATANPLRFGNAALVSGSFLAIFLVAYFLPLLKWTAATMHVAFPGYAKLHKSNVLNNKVRETMAQAIRADPGITPPQLQQLTGAGWSTVVYHLGVLEKNKLVSSIVDGRHKRFFPIDNVNWSDRGRIAALKNEQSRHLYELILEEPGVGPSDLSHRVGVSRSTIYWHVERLEKAGLVGRDRQRLKTVFFANPQAGTPYDPKTAVEVS